MHAVEELQEDGCEAAALAAGGQVTALAELVSERQPFLLHQDLEALQRPVERVTEQLHQRHHLQWRQAFLLMHREIEPDQTGTIVTS